MPLLVLGHKTDLLSKPAGGANVNAQAAVQRVRTILERELERRRRGAAAGGMAALGEDEAGGESGSGSGVGAGLDITGDEEDGFRFEKWEGGEVDVRAGWVDIKRSSDGHGHTTDEEEHEGEGEGDKGEEKRDEKREEKREDGLAEVVQWIVDLR